MREFLELTHKLELASDMVPKHVEDPWGSIEAKRITYGPITGQEKIFFKILFCTLWPQNKAQITEGKVTKMTK